MGSYYLIGNLIAANRISLYIVKFSFVVSSLWFPFFFFFFEVLSCRMV